MKIRKEIHKKGNPIVDSSIYMDYRDRKIQENKVTDKIRLFGNMTIFKVGNKWHGAGFFGRYGKTSSSYALAILAIDHISDNYKPNYETFPIKIFGADSFMLTNGNIYTDQEFPSINPKRTLSYRIYNKFSVAMRSKFCLPNSIDIEEFIKPKKDLKLPSEEPLKDISIFLLYDPDPDPHGLDKVVEEISFNSFFQELVDNVKPLLKVGQTVPNKERKIYLIKKIFEEIEIRCFKVCRRHHACDNEMEEEMEEQINAIAKQAIKTINKDT